MATERTPAMNEPTLIRGLSYRKVGKKIVEYRYAYMAARSTLFDEQLIEWARRRDAELNRERAA